MTAGSRQSFFALFHRDHRGTAAVEFALIAPILFLLILGITQFGITLNNYEMLTGGTGGGGAAVFNEPWQFDAIQQYQNRFVQCGIEPHASKHHIHTKGKWGCVHRRQCVPDRADQRARTARDDNDVISMQPDGLWVQLRPGLHITAQSTEMSNETATISLFPRLHRDRRGAVAMLTAAAIVASAGVGAIAVDVGYAVNAQRKLQASTDAAALAGALEIGSTTINPVTNSDELQRDFREPERCVQSQRHHGERLSRVEVLHQHRRDMRIWNVWSAIRQRHSGEAAGDRADILWQSDRHQFAEPLGDGHRRCQRRQGDPMDVMIIVDTTASMNTADFELQRGDKNRLRIGRRPGHVERVLAIRRPGRPAGVSGHDECDGLEGLHLPDQQSYHRAIRQLNAGAGVPDRRAVDRLQNVRRDNQLEYSLQYREGGWWRFRLLWDQGSRR